MAAIWFPPGYGGNQAPAGGAKTAEEITFAAALKAHEDRVVELIGKLGEAEQAIAYKYLYASGLRIDNADEQLRKAIRKELQKS